jgi:phosphoribosylformimino-5-aminoimidazole carboxamide ribotide isomerase
MIIYPAIDLLDGQCVRLSQGRYDQVTVYSNDPLYIAEGFADAGAKWIHMVDLNAAKTGIPVNQSIIAAVVKQTGLKVQTGGGIRNIDTLRYLIEEIGVSRCVIGTSAIKDRAFTEKALALYGDTIAIGLDAKNGEIAVDGWTSGSGINVIDFAKMMKEIGARTVIYTDIARDGMLSGPATESTRELFDATGLSVIASGGIGSEEDITLIQTSGCTGVIVGKAIYEGKVRLSVCLQNA